MTETAPSRRCRKGPPPKSERNTAIVVHRERGDSFGRIAKRFGLSEQRTTYIYRRERGETT